MNSVDGFVEFVVKLLNCYDYDDDDDDDVNM
jgi:hypothetical protein